MRPSEMSKQYDLFNVGDDEDDDNPTLDEVKTQFAKSDLPLKMKKGDTVRINGEGYRNCGVYVFDGETLRDLSTEHDSYGHLPEQFTIASYAPDHFKHTIDHNTFIWADLSKCVLENESRAVIPSNGVVLYMYTFEMAGEKHCVCVDESSKDELGKLSIYEYDPDWTALTKDVVKNYMKSHGIRENMAIYMIII